MKIKPSVLSGLGPSVMFGDNKAIVMNFHNDNRIRNIHTDFRRLYKKFPRRPFPLGISHNSGNSGGGGDFPLPLPEVTARHEQAITC